MTILQALSVTFSFTGQTLPDLALAEMAGDLAAYPEQDVMVALKRCRNELKSIKYSDILERLPNGHPGPEEAWAILSRGLAKNDFTLVEDLTIVWTDEMRSAYGVAMSLAGDAVAMRMTFKEAYQAQVSASRLDGSKPSWSVSGGTDRADKEAQIVEAVKLGRLTSEYGQRLLPYHDFTKDEAVKLLESEPLKRLGVL